MSPRRHGPGLALRKVRDAEGRRLWRARVWDGRGAVVELDQQGARAEVRAAAEQQLQNLIHREMR